MRKPDEDDDKTLRRCENLMRTMAKHALPAPARLWATPIVCSLSANWLALRLLNAASSYRLIGPRCTDQCDRLIGLSARIALPHRFIASADILDGLRCTNQAFCRIVSQNYVLAWDNVPIQPHE